MRARRACGLSTYGFSEKSIFLFVIPNAAYLRLHLTHTWVRLVSVWCQCLFCLSVRLSVCLFVFSYHGGECRGRWLRQDLAIGSWLVSNLCSSSVSFFGLWDENLALSPPFRLISLPPSLLVYLLFIDFWAGGFWSWALLDFGSLVGVFCFSFLFFLNRFII